MVVVNTALNTVIATVDEHGEIHVAAADAARLGVVPGEHVVVAAAPQPAIEVLPTTRTIDELAAEQGKTRRTVRGAAAFPQLLDSDDELDDFLELIGERA